MLLCVHQQSTIVLKSMRHLRKCLIGLTAGFVAACLMTWAAKRHLYCTKQIETNTLIVHIFADTDPEYMANFQFFVRHAISRTDGAEYIVIVQTDNFTTVKAIWYLPQNCNSFFSGGILLLQVEHLPPLPSNAKYVPHKNECYDWGAVGWLLLRSGHVDLSRFTYFVITNCSVRGPYLPTYLPVQ